VLSVSRLYIVDDRMFNEYGAVGMKVDRKKPKYSEKTCPSATLSSTNPT
jgi:hypothetical protein